MLYSEGCTRSLINMVFDTQQYSPEVVKGVVDDALGEIRRQKVNADEPIVFETVFKRLMDKYKNIRGCDLFVKLVTKSQKGDDADSVPLVVEFSQKLDQLHTGWKNLIFAENPESKCGEQDWVFAQVMVENAVFFTKADPADRGTLMRRMRKILKRQEKGTIELLYKEKKQEAAKEEALTEIELLDLQTTELKESEVSTGEKSRKLATELEQWKHEPIARMTSDDKKARDACTEAATLARAASYEAAAALQHHLAVVAKKQRAVRVHPDNLAEDVVAAAARLRGCQKAWGYAILYYILVEHDTGGKDFSDDFKEVTPLDDVQWGRLETLQNLIQDGLKPEYAIRVGAPLEGMPAASNNTQSDDKPVARGSCAVQDFFF